MTSNEFLEQINAIPHEEHIVYKAINQKALREIFSDYSVYNSIKTICKNGYTNLYYLFLTDEFVKNDIYFIFCKWIGGKFILMQGREYQYIDVLVDTKESPFARDDHEEQINNIKTALSEHSELLIDSGLRFNDKFVLTKVKTK